MPDNSGWRSRQLFYRIASTDWNLISYRWLQFDIYKSVVQSSVHWSEFHRSSVRILVRQNFLTKHSFTIQVLEKWYGHLLLGKVHVGANIFNFLLALTKEFFFIIFKDTIIQPRVFILHKIHIKIKMFNEILTHPV